MGHRWYVVRTKPKSEFLTVGELNRVDIEVFSPLVKTPGRTGSVVTPLFPGYVFVRLDWESQGWPSFRFGQHALGFVKFNGEVPSLPDEVIADLRQRCDWINQEGGTWRRFKPGDWVNVVSSTIQGLAQVVEDGKTAQAPVRVLLQFFERLVPVQVPRHELQPLDDSSRDKDHASRRTRGRGRWIQGFGPRALATG